MVIIPPRIVAKDSGIKLSLGDHFDFRAFCTSAGINNANVATLFIKAERIAPILPVNVMWVRSDLSVLKMFFEIWKIAPEFTNPVDTIKTNATITVAGCPNPEKAVSRGTNPPKIAKTRPANATIS